MTHIPRRFAVPAVLLSLALAACTPPGGSAPPTPAPTATTAGRTPIEAGQAFLATYVDGDGRVVRHDQGGDTVSEGQAYGMLIAVALGDEETFASVWGWTRENLQRPDGLLSWRWVDGAVADPQPASDADLDAARALALAGEAFDDPAYTDAATALGRAVLDHETARTDAGRILLAGPWADADPYQVNPSYPTPVATRLLADLDDDPRWAELDAGMRAVVGDLTGDGSLPPNWAQVDGEGRVEAVRGPDGSEIGFGYDAARTLVRYAESCDAQDHDVVAGTLDTLGTARVLHAQLDLDGTSATTDQHPLTHVSRAAVRALDGDRPGALADLAAADALLELYPTYFGSAWASLGRLTLETVRLGGCPPRERER